MKKAIQMQWYLIKKRNIIINTLLLSLLISLFYQIIFYWHCTNVNRLGHFITTFFFMDSSKNMFKFYLFIFLPVLCSIFYSWYTIDDQKTGYNLYSRIDLKKVIYSRLIINFFIGFTFCLSLFICLSLSTYLITLNKNTDYYYLSALQYSDSLIVQWGIPNGITNTTLGNLYFTSSHLYYGIYFFIISIYGGFQAIISTLIGYFTNKKIVCILSSFAIHFIAFIILIQLILPYPLSSYSIINLLDPFPSIMNTSIIPYLWIIYTVILISAIIITVRKIENRGF